MSTGIRNSIKSHPEIEELNEYRKLKPQNESKQTITKTEFSFEELP